MSQQCDTDVEKNESYVALTEVSSPDVLTILYSGNSKRTLTKCWVSTRGATKRVGDLEALLYEEWLMEWDI